MDAKLDLTTPDALVGVKRVDDAGTITGLGHHRGQEFILLRIPLDPDSLKDLERKGAKAAKDIAEAAEEYRRIAEERAARIAQELGLDPGATRRAIHEGTSWVDRLRDYGEGGHVRTTAGPSGETVRGSASDVAGSMRGGISSLLSHLGSAAPLPPSLAAEERDEKEALLQTARAAQKGAADWEPEGMARRASDRHSGGEDVPIRRGWNPGAGGP